MISNNIHKIHWWILVSFCFQASISLGQNIPSDSVHSKPFSSFKNEISIQLLTTKELDDKILGIPSVAYQISFKKFHFKAQLGYFTGENNNRSDLKDQREVYSIRVGGFYHSNLGHFQPFLGVEGFYGYSFRNYYTSYFQLREKTTAKGLSAVMGCRYWINNRFSVQINTRIDRYVENEYKYTNVEDDMAPDPNVTSYITIENESKKNRTKYSPIGSVGFSFHF